jgi:hypothetical protein
MVTWVRAPVALPCSTDCCVPAVGAAFAALALLRESAAALVWLVGTVVAVLAVLLPQALKSPAPVDNAPRVASRSVRRGSTARLERWGLDVRSGGYASGIGQLLPDGRQ